MATPRLFRQPELASPIPSTQDDVGDSRDFGAMPMRLRSKRAWLEVICPAVLLLSSLSTSALAANCKNDGGLLFWEPTSLIAVRSGFQARLPATTDWMPPRVIRPSTHGPAPAPACIYPLLQLFRAETAARTSFMVSTAGPIVLSTLRTSNATFSFPTTSSPLAW